MGEGTPDWTRGDATYTQHMQGELGLQSAADQIEACLEENEVVYEMTVDPRQMGVHWLNREVMEHEVPGLMSDISFVGWSARQLTHALASEEEPGRKTIEEHNIRITRGSKILAPVEPNTIIFGSLSCSHCNQGLRAIKAKMPCTDPAMSEKGVYSTAKIGQRPGGDLMVQAVETGFKWKVVRYVVAKERPKWLDLLQEARNIQGQLQRPITEAQILVNMHKYYVDQMEAGGEADWQVIKRAVLRSRPPCADIIDDLAFFLVKRSGGMKGHSLRDWSLYHRTVAGARRIPGPVYAAAAKLPWFTVSIAVLKTAATCPKEFVENGVCRWLSENDVLALGRGEEKQRLGELSERLLEGARTILHETGIKEDIGEDKRLSKVFGFLDCSVGMILFNKGKASKVAAGVRILQAAFSFQKKLKEAFPQAILVAYDSAWLPMMSNERRTAMEAGGAEASARAFGIGRDRKGQGTRRAVSRRGRTCTGPPPRNPHGRTHTHTYVRTYVRVSVRTSVFAGLDACAGGGLCTSARPRARLSVFLSPCAP